MPHKQLDGMTPFEAWSGHKPDVTQSQECLFFGYFEDSKGYKLIKFSTKKSFIERSVQFQVEPLVEVEVGESYSPPDPLIVSGETNEFVDSDMSDNDDFIADPNIPTRPKWEENTIHAAEELAGNPNDTRRTRSQFESALCVKDPLFHDKWYLMVKSDPNTY